MYLSATGCEASEPLRISSTPSQQARPCLQVLCVLRMPNAGMMNYGELPLSAKLCPVVNGSLKATSLTWWKLSIKTLKSNTTNLSSIHPLRDLQTQMPNANLNVLFVFIKNKLPRLVKKQKIERSNFYRFRFGAIIKQPATNTSPPSRPIATISSG